MTEGTVAELPAKRKRLRNGERVPCSVPHCEHHAQCKGMCRKHYLRFHRHGNTEGILDFGDPVTRFHKKYHVNSETGCWEWSCYLHPNGYGMLSIGKHQKVRAHRYSYETFVGPIPDGLLVCHRCDLPRCVNPGHLFVGTAGDNRRDASRKGRLRGSSAKLSREKAATMRVLYARGGHSIINLAWIYGISEETARAVVKGETWLAI